MGCRARRRLFGGRRTTCWKSPVPARKALLPRLHRRQRRPLAVTSAWAGMNEEGEPPTRMPARPSCSTSRCGVGWSPRCCSGMPWPRAPHPRLRAGGGLPHAAPRRWIRDRRTRWRSPPIWPSRPTSRRNSPRSQTPVGAAASFRAGRTRSRRGMPRRPADPRRTLVWTLTDGIAYFRGSAAPALARLHGLRDHRFRRFAVRALPGQVPLRRGACGARPAGAGGGLARNGEWLVAAGIAKPATSSSRTGSAPRSASGPIRAAESLDHALELSRRVFAAYRDDVVVQPYVPAEMCVQAFSAVTPEAGVEALGVFFVDSGGDFQTMADSMALYGETGATRQGRRPLCRAGTRPVVGTPAGGRPQRSARSAGADAGSACATCFRWICGSRRTDRPPDRVRGLPGSALFRLPRLLPGAMGHEPRRRHGRNGRGRFRPVEALTVRRWQFRPSWLDLGHADRRVAGADEAELARRCLRNVNDAALDEGAAIVDANDHVLPLRLLVTFTLVPKGRLRWAAVSAAGFMRSPEAVLEVSAYQDARPHWADAAPADKERATPARIASAKARFCIVGESSNR